MTKSADAHILPRQPNSTFIEVIIMPLPQNPTAAIIVIGDEILSGRTQDSNTFYLAGQLTAHGINLKEVRVVSDDANAIIDSVRDLSNNYTHVFTCGEVVFRS